MKSLFVLRKRQFLNPVSTGLTSYILVEVEASHDGTYKSGTNMLTLADCRRRVQLEFFLGTKRARRESLRKIDLLMNNLDQYRTALRTEADLITQYEEQQKSRPRKSKKGAKK